METDRESESRIMTEIKGTINHVEKSLFYGNFLKQMKNSEIMSKMKGVAEKNLAYCGIEMVVYGIGSFSSTADKDSRLQLALTFLFKRNCEFIGDVLLYDPILTTLEIQIIRNLGFIWIPTNEEGKKAIEKPTLFFMAHTPFSLVNYVLEANWTPNNLNKIIVLGGSFKYEKLNEERFGRLRSVLCKKHVNKIFGRYPRAILQDEHTSEFAVSTDNYEDGEASRDYKSAFSGISWHFFEYSESASDLKRLIDDATIESVGQMLLNEMKKRKSQFSPEGLRQKLEGCGLPNFEILEIGPQFEYIRAVIT